MAKTFNPGSFRHDIVFLYQTDEKDGYRARLDEWFEYKKVKASKEPLIGKELYAALTEDTKIEVKFRMRYFPGVTAAMRIRHGGETYRIISAVDVDAAHKELVCYCRLVDYV